MGTDPSAILNVVSMLMLLCGLYCLLAQRRVVKQIIGLSIMLQGALTALLAAGLRTGEMALAQSFIISALLSEAIVLAIALALMVNVYRYYPEGWIDDLSTLKG